jgi:hypothetical protein
MAAEMGLKARAIVKQLILPSCLRVTGTGERMRLQEKITLDAMGENKMLNGNGAILVPVR